MIGFKPYLIKISSIAVWVMLFSFSGITKLTSNDQDKTETALFAIQSFWLPEAVVELEPGIVEVMAGYAGGEQHHPRYEEVAQEKTGYREAVKIVFDPNVINYSDLLTAFLKNGDLIDHSDHDPYIIYCYNTDQEQMARDTLRKLGLYSQDGQVSMIDIEQAKTFYKAEPIIQYYFQSKMNRYNESSITAEQDKLSTTDHL